ELSKIPHKIQQKQSAAIISVWKNMTVQDLAAAMGRDIDQVFEAMLYVENADAYDSPTSQINQLGVIVETVKRCGMRCVTIASPDSIHDFSSDSKDVTRRPPPDRKMMVKCPPVVTIMGHVDHGKTTLLDSLRHSHIVETEYGGITQHIGAFSVKLETGESVTFLDTPGHAAFSAMRARGATVTDIVVLIVAADDGVKEQTIESLHLAREAQGAILPFSLLDLILYISTHTEDSFLPVPIIVAINKIDKVGVDLKEQRKRVREEKKELKEIEVKKRKDERKAKKNQQKSVAGEPERVTGKPKKRIKEDMVTVTNVGLTKKPGENKSTKGLRLTERCKRMLLGQGLDLEEFGGDVQCIPISALEGKNLDLLIDAILTQAEISDIRCDPKGPVEGVIIESCTDPGRGKLCTAIIQRGTLYKGTILVAGEAWAKVRSMFNDQGLPILDAPPATPVEIVGWRELPSAGDEILEVPSEKKAHEVVAWRRHVHLQEKGDQDLSAIQEKMEEHLRVYKAELEERRRLRVRRLRRRGLRPKENPSFPDDNSRLAIVIKGDVDGSVEAILDVLDTYHSPLCHLDIIHYGIGAVSMKDIEFAEAFQGQSLGVQLCDSALFPSFTFPYSLLGEADVLQEFLVSEGRKKIPVAGSRCTKGVLKKSANFRVLRGGNILHEGSLSSMRHLKNEVDAIKKDTECGLCFQDISLRFQPGDTIICFQIVKQPQKIDWDPGF
ncbi:unnamed protein product, partial [Darwinula stevensoni]